MNRTIQRWVGSPDIMAKILLAEDDDSLRGFLVNALKRAGHVVKDFDEGRSALKALEREVFDLLLTDIVMPGLDGIELARRGSELDPAMKIVFITGFAGGTLTSIELQLTGYVRSNIRVENEDLARGYTLTVGSSLRIARALAARNGRYTSPIRVSSRSTPGPGGCPGARHSPSMPEASSRSWTH